MFKRLLKFLLVIPIAIAIITVCVNNQQPVTLSLWPFVYEVTAPFYLFGIFFIAVGFVLSWLYFVWVWTINRIVHLFSPSPPPKKKGREKSNGSSRDDGEDVGRGKNYF